MRPCRSSVAATTQRPPSTGASPNRSTRRAMCRMPVEGRQNHGLPPNCGGKVVERALEPESLDRQQYDVERLGRRARDEQARLYTEVAVRAEDPEADAPELVGPLRPHEKGYVPPRVGEPGPEISAGRAGADDQNAHGSVSLFNRSSAAAPAPAAARRARDAWRAGAELQRGAGDDFKAGGLIINAARNSSLRPILTGRTRE